MNNKLVNFIMYACVYMSRVHTPACCVYVYMVLIII